MKILVTGGSGVIGAGVIPELLKRNHEVRLLSRHAEEDAGRWKGVEPFEGDVADSESLRGSGATCDAVMHIAGIATESGPEATFENVNVGGTRNVIEEMNRSGVRRLVYVSSLGADRGSSDYQRSKHDAEKLVQSSDLDWTIVRPGGVYGPGDEVISNVMKMVRVLPAVPVIDSGDQPFQPIWYADLGAALATVVERGDLTNETLELAGPDVTSLNDLIERLREITGRKPVTVRVPMPLASLVTKLASLAIEMPIDETKLTMLQEKNVLSDPDTRPLETLGVAATPLDDGLRKLADLLPEQTPDEGVGPMLHKRIWADISGSSHSPASLMSLFRDRVTDAMPVEFASEPGAPTRIEYGVTMTGSLPLRGHFQVRAELVDSTRVILATVDGHPLAGFVEFTTTETGGALRFEVDVYARSANLIDLAAMMTVGEPAQSANWRGVVERMIELSGGTSDGVQQESKKLDDAEAEEAVNRIRSLIQKRERNESAPTERAAQR
jgi:uncharacterized protein YbjT (DUF2867 family)